MQLPLDDTVRDSCVAIKIPVDAPLDCSGSDRNCPDLVVGIASAIQVKGPCAIQTDRI
jgi:hypothetical protein